MGVKGKPAFFWEEGKFSAAKINMGERESGEFCFPTGLRLGSLEDLHLI